MRTLQSVDDEIDRRNNRRRDETKVDRYGKKYSWIAYFEMYGKRVDEGVLPTYEGEVHPSDCDIDPSFPNETKEWRPELPKLFETEYSEYSEWISGGPNPSYEDLFVKDTIDGVEGPWVLLDGNVEQASLDALRIFTFLRGVLIADEDVSELKQKLRETEYPGNRNIRTPRRISILTLVKSRGLIGTGRICVKTMVQQRGISSEPLALI